MGRGNDRMLIVTAAISLAASLGWVLLSVAHPATTYHLAPVLVTALAAVWPRFRAENPLSIGAAAGSAAVGAVSASIVAGVIYGLHSMNGPTMFNIASPLVESFLGIVVGFLIGKVIAAVPRRSGRRS